jgi:pimeloyl-ACP methyl ester carboxylesterase
MQGAIKTGIWGWLDDDIAAVKDWGFDLTPIRVPVDIWHGEDDEFVPPAHGEWLAANIPGASSHLCRSKGHFSLADEFDKVVDLFQKMG